MKVSEGTKAVRSELAKLASLMLKQKGFKADGSKRKQSKGRKSKGT